MITYCQRRHNKSCSSENQVLEVIHFNEIIMLETPIFRQFNELDIKRALERLEARMNLGKHSLNLVIAPGMSAILQFAHAGDGRSWKQV
jgi:hypothetical protein